MRLRSYRPHLPLELIACIIDYLDCAVALKNCSRVCHAWLPLSRSHIFRVLSVFLNDRRVFKRLQGLNNTIDQSPCISTYVSELCIMETFGCHAMLSYAPHKLDTVLPSLLYKLTNLRKIAVSGMDWTNMTTPEIRSAVRTLIHRPSFVHLVVNSFEFAQLVHLTTLLPPTLKRLDIDNIWGAESSDVIDEENKRPPPQKPCQLEYLKCRVSSALVDRVLNSQQVDISKVHTLDVFSVFDESECISRIAKKSGSSLEHLHVTYQYTSVSLLLFVRSPAYLILV